MWNKYEGEINGAQNTSLQRNNRSFSSQWIQLFVRFVAIVFNSLCCKFFYLGLLTFLKIHKLKRSFGIAAICPEAGRVLAFGNVYLKKQIGRKRLRRQEFSLINGAREGQISYCKWH
jgi:hypothetical protein